MHKRIAISLLTLGLVLLGLYGYRRRLLSRLLGLSSALYNVDVERGLRIPMPDGVELVADRYFPRSPGRFPTVLVRTPYGRRGRDKTVVLRLLAERGYNAVIQDVRGRFDSAGEFGFLAGEEADGRATMGWISERPWFDGSLGLWGESYLGYAQWAAAPGAPPYLKAIMPFLTASRFRTVIHPDGAFALDVALPVSVILGSQEDDSTLWFLKNALLPFRIRRGFSRLPVGKADIEAVGRSLVHFREWLSRPEDDAYWIKRDQRDQVSRVNARAHLFGGWYDMFLRQVLDDYGALAAAGKEPYLTVGPYPHGSVGGFVDAVRETLDWFGLCLKGEIDSARTKPVRLYVTGAGEWRDLDAWPPPAEEERYHLHADGRLSQEAPPADVQPDRYRYDPADPTPAVGGPLFGMSGRRGAVDNRKLESRRDVLVYTTPPLHGEMEVIGPVRLELYTRSNLEHTDFFGRLCDVHPDGRSFNVCDGLLRLKPGKGLTRSDGGLRIEVDMWATAHRFRKGHRVRLQVSSGAHPRWSRNLGTGEPAETAAVGLLAEQTVYHDHDRPSAMILPIAASLSAQ